MNDRLVMIIQESLNKHIGKSCLLAQNIADDILKNSGIIVAPMPMTEGLRQELTEYVHQRCVDEL